MEALSGIVKAQDGRPIIAGCGILPPIENEGRANADKPTEHIKRNGKAGDRFTILNAFVDCSMSDLTKVEVQTWLILYRDSRNGIATTSQSDIARRSGVSDRSVRSAIRQLSKRGLISVVRRGGLLQGPSRYRVFGNTGNA